MFADVVVIAVVMGGVAIVIIWYGCDVCIYVCARTLSSSMKESEESSQDSLSVTTCSLLERDWIYCWQLARSVWYNCRMVMIIIT